MNTLVSLAAAHGEARRVKAAIQDEIDALIARFEHDSIALPPSEDALKLWTHEALKIGQRIRMANCIGKSTLLRRLQRFQWQLRQTRGARRRFLSNRPVFPDGSSLPPHWDDEGVGLSRTQLADAIHSFVAQTADPVAIPLAAEEPVREVELPGPAAALPGIPRRHREVAKPRRFSHPSPTRVSRSTRSDPIMAIEGRLALPDAHGRAKEVAVAWLRRKGIAVPDGASDGFELESRNGQNRAIAVAWKKVWALQAETADQHLPGRRWRVEMVLVDNQPTAAVGVRLTAVSPADQPPPPPSVPGLVSELIAQIGLLDGEANEQLFAGPTDVSSTAALREMLLSLRSPLRRRPAIVLSRYTKGDRQATLMNPAELAKLLRGVARVYVLSREMSWGLTHELSKRFTVAGASVRLFRPGFTEDDDPGHHPRWDPAALRAQSLTLAELSALFLRDATEASVHALEREDAVPPFDRIRERVLRRQIEEARDLARQQLASSGRNSDAAVKALEQQLRDEESLRAMFESESSDLEQELRQLRKERDDLRDECSQLRSHNYHLQTRISQLREQPELEGCSVPYPESWDDLEVWCEDHLEGAVVVTSKAIRAARDSEFRDIPFAYQVLHFLASVYVPCRRGDIGVDRLDAEKARLRIDISPVGKGAEERRSRDMYSTTYMSKRVILDMHVKGSSDKDPRFGFRLYFHWQDPDHPLIVGSFPTHLDNGMS